jgi:hypothetical protein
LYDTRRTDEANILNNTNWKNKNLTLKLTTEERNELNHLNLEITRITNQDQINVYWKLSTTSTTIYCDSNHPIQQQLAAYRFYLQRIRSLPLTQENK